MKDRNRTPRLVSLALAAACTFTAGCMSRGLAPEEPLEHGVDAEWALGKSQDGEQESDPLPMDEGDAPAGDEAADGAAGSNPLAAVSKVDLIWQHLDLTTSGDNIEDYSVSPFPKTIGRRPTSSCPTTGRTKSGP